MKGLTIRENKNFSKVSLYNKEITIQEILNEKQTKHCSRERNERYNFAISLNEENGEQAEIEKIFLVDKNHEEGVELHCVTKRGLIFILNKEKYEKHINSFITILIARPHQIRRLYSECGLVPNKEIIDYALDNQKNGYNN